MRLTSLTLAAALFAGSAVAPAFAESHSTGDGTMDHSKMGHGTMDHSKMSDGKMDHSMMEGVHTMATINSIDGDTYNVTHPPIPALKWPAMTMDMKLVEGAKVMETAGAGDKVMLMLEQGDDGMYGISAVMPAK